MTENERKQHEEAIKQLHEAIVLELAALKDPRLDKSLIFHNIENYNRSIQEHYNAIAESTK